MLIYDIILLVVRQNGMKTGSGRSLSAKQSLAIVASLAPEEFHETSECLVDFACLPVCPGEKDAEQMLNALMALS